MTMPPKIWFHTQHASLSKRPIVCIQGLGFVGTAMAVAVASALDTHHEPYFNVAGIDLDTPQGQKKINAINDGVLPFACTDHKLIAALKKAHERGNLMATANPEIYRQASVVIVDIPFHISPNALNAKLAIQNFLTAIQPFLELIQPSCLVMIESTVPPGFCEKIVAPEMHSHFKARGYPEQPLNLSYSFERVMPGPNYLESITHFWRVYAGHSRQAAKLCKTFLSKIICTEHFPLTELPSITACELTKILENTYRANLIAFMEEWGRYAEGIGVDLFSIIEAIRQRPTHSNIRQPGFGVGGYCLTKDPLLAKISAHTLYHLENLQFPFSELALTINQSMPLISLEKVKMALGGTLQGRNLLLLGASYRADVDDTRHSPSEIFVKQAQAQGAHITCHDPLVRYWQELNLDISNELPDARFYDALIFSVPHAPYRELDFTTWLAGHTPLIFDANQVLTQEQRSHIRTLGCALESIGRGDSL